MAPPHRQLKSIRNPHAPPKRGVFHFPPHEKTLSLRGRKAPVGSEPSAASGRGSEVSEWPRSKFPASAARQRRNFGHRNRDIRIPVLKTPLRKES